MNTSNLKENDIVYWAFRVKDKYYLRKRFYKGFAKEYQSEYGYGYDLRTHYLSKYKNDSFPKFYEASEEEIFETRDAALRHLNYLIKHEIDECNKIIKNLRSQYKKVNKVAK